MLIADIDDPKIQEIIRKHLDAPGDTEDKARSARNEAFDTYSLYTDGRFSIPSVGAFEMEIDRILKEWEK